MRRPVERLAVLVVMLVALLVTVAGGKIGPACWSPLVVAMSCQGDGTGSAGQPVTIRPGATLMVAGRAGNAPRKATW